MRNTNKDSADSEDPDSEIEQSIGFSKRSQSVRPGSKFTRTLPTEKIKQRVPDTEHLTRMRAILLEAHQNEATLKLLLENKQYIPKNLDPAGSAHMGDSFKEVMKKTKVRLDRKIEKA